ncbi:MAG: hypothetical protein EBX47_10680 [Synechococcaceae bacterium WB8_1B_057]|nr:hypothetical protein [Synechococcaceae bacterium WB8_1B_057]
MTCGDARITDESGHVYTTGQGHTTTYYQRHSVFIYPEKLADRWPLRGQSAAKDQADKCHNQS